MPATQPALFALFDQQKRLSKQLADARVTLNQLRTAETTANRAYQTSPSPEVADIRRVVWARTLEAVEHQAAVVGRMHEAWLAANEVSELGALIESATS